MIHVIAFINATIVSNVYYTITQHVIFGEPATRKDLDIVSLCGYATYLQFTDKIVHGMVTAPY